MAATSIFVLGGGPNCLLSLQETSRSAGRSDLGSLRNRISVSYNLLALLCISPGDFQRQRVLGVVFPVQDPPGTQRGLRPLVPWGRNMQL